MIIFAVGNAGALVIFLSWVWYSHTSVSLGLFVSAIVWAILIGAQFAVAFLHEVKND